MTIGLSARRRTPRPRLSRRQRAARRTAWLLAFPVLAGLAVFFAVLFAAGLSVAAVSFQKFRQWEKIDETLRSSYESTIRDKEMLGEVSERASEQIAAIDLISGYLKF